MPSKAKAKVTQVFEQDTPLDSSVLWTWIQHFYSQGGVEVWSDGDVPFHITNTPVLAQEWARSIIASLRDFARMELLDPEHPVEIYELGPGTGRHAFFLIRELKRLEQLTQSFCSSKLRFRLHLAELGIPGLSSLSKHPNLQNYFESGDLYLHQFDIDKDERPKLFHPKKSELKLPSKNPSFVIGNYILDSLPHDVVRVDQGEIFLGLTDLRVVGMKKGKAPTEIPDLGKKIELSFHYSEEEPKYDNPSWNEIIQQYKTLPGETHIPFPTSSFRLAQRARDWSEVATVFLIADKSFTTMHQLMQLDEPELVPHGGGFSFNANLHAFGLLAQNSGGTAHHTCSRDGTLDLSHVVFPASLRERNSWDFLESRFRYDDLERFHAIDKFRTKESVDELERDYPLRLCLDLFRLTGFDPQIFYELSDDILEGLANETEDICELEEELAYVLPLCLAQTYPLADDVDVAFEIGRVAYRMEAYELARRAFVKSTEGYGEDARTRFNLGLTWYYREYWEKAIHEFKQALVLDEEYKDAKLWLKKTQSKLSPV